MTSPWSQTSGLSSGDMLTTYVEYDILSSAGDGQSNMGWSSRFELADWEQSLDGRTGWWNPRRSRSQELVQDVLNRREGDGFPVKWAWTAC